MFTEQAYPLYKIVSIKFVIFYYNISVEDIQMRLAENEIPRILC